MLATEVPRPASRPEQHSQDSEPGFAGGIDTSQEIDELTPRASRPIETSSALAEAVSRRVDVAPTAGITIPFQRTSRRERRFISSATLGGFRRLAEVTTTGERAVDTTECERYAVVSAASTQAITIANKAEAIGEGLRCGRTRQDLNCFTVYYRHSRCETRGAELFTAQQN